LEINDGIGKFTGDYVPKLTLDARESLRHTHYPLNCSINRTSELVTKPRRKLLVPRLSLKKFLFGFWPENKLH